MLAAIGLLIFVFGWVGRWLAAVSPWSSWAIWANVIGFYAKIFGAALMIASIILWLVAHAA
jgi:hypothetical protein